ncbi:dTDP-4-dehydrorhamnose 3,5-epimerase [Parvibium lacunae]|uniref:dTDP-4-dehydrorhamnose 3,5-epimerase n=1 Tax=Parvibium lacunae TaxID=1888893 RepID=A0A368L1R1_9BURK|nr:dTDP-4-dehydrorhamnose 3,5-epimerase [Parvibium lacunae]RCS57413.1 dTDP-4-dehydrorhamnose 3,5-epimerase [Parvibium lacunae]
MHIHRSDAIAGMLIFYPEEHVDHRGALREVYRQDVVDEHLAYDARFVMEVQSTSTKGVLRGLHYQIEQPQAKLVRVLAGSIYDVVVDLRLASPSYGKWVGLNASADNGMQIYVPAGCAHGFLCLEEATTVLYKVSQYRDPDYERIIRWDDPLLAIHWPVGISAAVAEPILSLRDQQAPYLVSLPSIDLPEYD